VDGQLIKKKNHTLCGCEGARRRPVTH